jgi:hypothetical protein
VYTDTSLQVDVPEEPPRIDLKSIENSSRSKLQPYATPKKSKKSSPQTAKVKQSSKIIRVSTKKKLPDISEVDEDGKILGSRLNYFNGIFVIV